MSHRMQITLTDAQYELLLSQSRIAGSPIAELVRRSIDAAYGSPGRSNDARLSAARTARGLWAGRGSEVFATWRAMRGERSNV